MLEATVDLLQARGVDALTVSDIARRAGVHETSIYRRWGTKANVVLEAVLSRLELEVPIPDAGSLRGDLLALLRGIAVFLKSPLGHALLEMAARHDLPEYDRARESFWTTRQSVGAAVLERAEVRGELRPGVDRRIALEALVGLLSLRVLLTREPIDDELLSAAVDLVLAGIATTPGPMPSIDEIDVVQT